MKKIFILWLLAFTALSAFSQVNIIAKDAPAHIGDSVQVVAKVFSAKMLNNGITLLNLGGDYPNQLLVAMISVKDRRKFSYKPEEDLIGQTLIFFGKLMEYKGKPQLILTDPNQIQAAGF